jgi:hypothetical protein
MAAAVLLCARRWIAAKNELVVGSGVDQESLTSLMKCAYGSPIEVTDQNYMNLLKLAKKCESPLRW